MEGKPIRCIKRLGNDLVAVGCDNHLRFFKVDVKANTAILDGNKLLDGKCISSFIETSPGRILCCSKDTNEYWLVDVV